MTNGGEAGEKGGIYSGEAKEVDVSDVDANTLAEIQKQVGETGVDLNVTYDPVTKKAKAKPTITIGFKKGKKLPTEKPL